jgi:hypothetical protein
MSTEKQNAIWKSVQVSAQQTSVAVWTPVAGKRIAITHIQIGAQGATAAKMTLYLSAGAGAYVEGTSQPVFKGSFAPVAASGQFPQALVTPTKPLIGAINDVLKITTSAALDCDVIVYGYEI